MAIVQDNTAIPPSSAEVAVEAAVEKLYIEPASEIHTDDVVRDKETDTWQFDDHAALKLVIDDAALADNYLNILQWASGWTLADTLYQSPASTSAFDGGQVAQANVPKFMLSNHINSVVPKIMGGIFYEKPPFELRPRMGTNPDVVLAKKALFTTQLDQMDFEHECEMTVEHCALFGTGIMKWGYTEHTKKQKRHQRLSPREKFESPDGKVTYRDTPASNKFKIVYSDKLVSHPWIKFCDIRTVLIDPLTRQGDIRKAKWIIYRDYCDYAYLDKLREVPGYKIPSEPALKQMFMKNPTSVGADNIAMTIPENMYGYIQHALPRNYKTSADPLKSQLEILERWDDEKLVVVLSYNGHNILIFNGPNPYQQKPFFSFNWRNIPDCFYGQGLGILVGSEQLVEQGVTNLALDLLAYGLQPTAVRKRGFNTLPQNIRWKQGGIIDVDEDVEKAFKFLQMPGVPSEAWAFISQSQSAGASNSGANEQVVQGIGAPGVKTTGMRSGTGAAAVVQANASRLDGPTSRFVRQIFEPWLAVMDDLDNDLLPSEVLREVLDDKLGQAFEMDHIEFRDGVLEYEVLAGSKLGAKKEMAQFLPLLMQMFIAPAFLDGITKAGYKWQPVEIFKAFAAAAGWKYAQNFLVPMTDQEKKQRDANQPAAIAARQQQAQQGQQQQKFQQEQRLEDQRQLGKAQNEVLRSAIEHSMAPEVTGEPSSEGFGAETVL